ncbi:MULTISPECIES: class I SAM-dependent methyltransferase [Okeania]|uniref:class I SAM-dependent methyltransferase n=1 Tax=Okeania TaxID=1458928 RepID=UPI000F546226|nr:MULTISPECIES: class I SAM-dependent methyltransferase [Okeania]NET15727.1 hypothetical protein [Okeania sp. SIO1H6]NES77365.1 hypothetical protein [Okeania sp. SIO1H4]NES92471.1 hypothetical protein [Okeania sp. SIO2B9]NET22382.1 hypothetical protein [Okeania sp. SIO1H5]NET77532.1 hypothetical protein [Okeania sp. SIO1F9]
MKWFFALNEAGPKFADISKMVKVAVLTARQNTSLEAFCIYDGQENNELTRWLEKNGVKLIFHRTPHYEVFKKNMAERSFKMACGAYLRVEIPKIMEINSIADDYVLYTDCDVMFVGDVVEYLSSIKCEYLAAALENPTKLDFLNSGVLYMNVKKQQEVYEDFNQFIKDNNGIFSSFDQGAYNQFFSKKWERLDSMMNWRSYWKLNTNAKIIHFHGPKPTQVQAIKEKTIPEHQLPLANQFFWQNTKVWENKYEQREEPESLNFSDQNSNHEQDTKLNNKHKHSKMQEIEQKLETSSDPTQNPDFLKSLFELNSVIAETNTPLEGNICYLNGWTSDMFQNTPPCNAPHLVLKRKNLVAATANRRRMLEIGFNGGHSALITLYHNPFIELHCVDICRHSYTELAAKFLQKKYPNRFYFYKGDSRDVLPMIAVKNRYIKFDVLHVDGGHGGNICRTDISNSIRLAANNSILILDDTGAKHILNIYWEYVRFGYLLPIKKFANDPIEAHRIAQVILKPEEISTF